ncbi:uncharacterized protein LOC103709771 [Phoenix dactylifera]|uniref:Uncharacterized protein LOC103709771 n=1 Tax=Phoenix dactylifera TaxID=42345 RepID=A0A8B7C7P4_PHODC|nr:uncharacterized protein LOC103709771 [Phoenix dactylifera]
MEKDDSAGPATSLRASKLRYPLRSAARPKEGNPAIADSSNSTSKRGRPPSVVSKSVSALDISGKEKSAKPPRRLSIPTKPTASPRQAPFGSITPISETRMKRSNTPGKSDTPVSDVSKSMTRRKFSMISSVSYWLAQIKLSESASKHSISLGFFKLAMESGCEPLDRVRDELKSYACRHNLVAELGEPAKDLLKMYNIVEDLEQLKVSESCSQLAAEGNQISDKGPRSFSAASKSGNLKTKSLNSNTVAVAESNKRENVQKRKPASKNKGSCNESPVSALSVEDTNGSNAQKKSRQPRKTESNRGKGKIKSSPKKSIMPESVDSADPFPIEETSFEDKENMNIQLIDGARIEETQTN